LLFEASKNGKREENDMPRLLLTALAVAIATTGAVYGQDISGRSCSEVATKAKQMYANAPRPVVCNSNIDQQRASCLQTGTWQRASGQPISNLQQQ
jgi:hypothetical protein